MMLFCQNVKNDAILQIWCYFLKMHYFAKMWKMMLFCKYDVTFWKCTILPKWHFLLRFNLDIEMIGWLHTMRQWMILFVYMRTPITPHAPRKKCKLRELLKDAYCTIRRPKKQCATLPLHYTTTTTVKYHHQF